jgi:regulator of protease activity HflC (stomatin/prohibitin superfamily)
MPFLDVLPQSAAAFGLPIAFCIIGVIVVVLLVLLATAVRVVPEYQRLVVFRLGRVLAAKGPGLVLLLPFIDIPRTVDLREQVREVPHQTSITKDNAPISIDFLWFYKVFDPALTVVGVGNFELAAQGIATTTLRSVIGGIALDDVLSQREHINQMLRVKLDEVTERWGVKVSNVEIREIIPPREVQEAMNRQMSAERTRRALVTESTGDKEAAINRAEGERQSAILRAEGDAQARVLRAQGEAEAIQKVFDAIHAGDADEKVLAYQYLQALPTLANGTSNKVWIVPAELSKAMEHLGSAFNARTEPKPTIAPDAGGDKVLEG